MRCAHFPLVIHTVAYFLIAQQSRQYFTAGLYILILFPPANNLTEPAVRRLQHLLHGCRNANESIRQIRIPQTFSEEPNREVKSDQRFFDTQSGDPEVLESGKDPDGRTAVQEMKRCGHNDAAWLAHFPSDSVSVSPLSVARGDCGADLVKKNIQPNISPFCEDNTNVCSNPEGEGLNATENVSAFSLNSKLCLSTLSPCALDSRLKFLDCCSSAPVVVTTKDAATSSMSACW